MVKFITTKLNIVMSNYRRRRKAPPKDSTKKFNVNENIEGEQFRVIDAEGSMLGIFSRSETFAMAEDLGVDVVEINPKADPKVVKLIDFNKLKYQISKNTTKSKTEEIKTIRVSVRISINDLKVRAKKIDEFLQEGKKVKIQIQMKGREKTHPEVAQETMNTFLGLITQGYNFENEPSLSGDSYIASLIPKTKK